MARAIDGGGLHFRISVKTIFVYAACRRTTNPRRALRISCQKQCIAPTIWTLAQAVFGRMIRPTVGSGEIDENRKGKQAQKYRKHRCEPSIDVERSLFRRRCLLDSEEALFCFSVHVFRRSPWRPRLVPPFSGQSENLPEPSDPRASMTAWGRLGRIHVIDPPLGKKDRKHSQPALEGSILLPVRDGCVRSESHVETPTKRTWTEGSIFFHPKPMACRWVPSKNDPSSRGDPDTTNSLATDAVVSPRSSLVRGRPF
eukprot:scaffold718_cov342-Pavlova_lutheri.AAC.8